MASFSDRGVTQRREAAKKERKRETNTTENEIAKNRPKNNFDIEPYGLIGDNEEHKTSQLQAAVSGVFAVLVMP